MSSFAAGGGGCLFVVERHTHTLPVGEALSNVGQFLRRGPDDERHKTIGLDLRLRSHHRHTIQHELRHRAKKRVTRS